MTTTTTTARAKARVHRKIIMAALSQRRHTSGELAVLCECSPRTVWDRIRKELEDGQVKIEESWDGTKVYALDAAKRLEHLLAKHDWFYTMSDDHRCWEAGEAGYREIRGLLPKVDAETARQLWAQHAPARWPFPGDPPHPESEAPDDVGV